MQCGVVALVRGATRSGPSFRRLLLSIGNLERTCYGVGAGEHVRMGGCHLSSLLSTLRHRVSWEIADLRSSMTADTLDLQVHRTSLFRGVFGITVSITAHAPRKQILMGRTRDVVKVEKRFYWGDRWMRGDATSTEGALVFT